MASEAYTPPIGRLRHANGEEYVLPLPEAAALAVWHGATLTLEGDTLVLPIQLQDANHVSLPGLTGVILTVHLGTFWDNLVKKPVDKSAYRLLVTQYDPTVYLNNLKVGDGHCSALTDDQAGSVTWMPGAAPPPDLRQTILAMVQSLMVTPIPHWPKSPLPSGQQRTSQ